METVTDDDLMMLYRNGDHDAFDVLFDRYYQTVYHFAWSLLNDPHRAADVLQETFLTLVKQVHNYEARGYFKTWLLRICRNCCFNMIEAGKVRRSLSLDNGFELILPDSSNAGPDRQLESDDRLSLVRQAIARLPERQREAITLYAYEHLSYKEIADVLEIPMNTVKTLIHRAREALKETLAQTT